MKRYFHAITLFLCVLISYHVNAQSFESLLSEAERIKVAYGENDDRYLDALSKVIQTASEENKLDDAFKYRQLHTNIVKEKYGSNSFEYAEDLWRLGNTAKRLNYDSYIDYYKSAIKIYEDNKGQLEFPYCPLTWNMALHYENKEQKETAIDYYKKHIICAKQWLNKQWKGINPTVTITNLTTAISSLGLLYYDIGNYALSNAAFIQYVELMESSDLSKTDNDIYPYYQEIIWYYGYIKDYESQKKWYLHYLDITKQRNGETSDEYINQLSKLCLCYYSLKDLQSIESTTNHLLSCLEKRAQEKNFDINYDSTYIAVQKELISYCVAFSNFYAAANYGDKLIELLNKTGKQETEEYWKVLGDLVFNHFYIGDYPTAYSLSQSYEDLCKKLNKCETDEYAEFLLCKIEMLCYLYKMDEFDITIKDAEPVIIKMYGKKSIEYINYLLSIALQYKSLDKNEQSLTYVQKCYEIINSKKFQFDSFYDKNLMLSKLHNLEGYIYITTNPDKAEELLLKSIEESRSIGDNAWAPLTNLGVYYFSIHLNYKKALDYFLLAKQEQEHFGDTISINYIMTFNNLGLCYMEMGQPAYAISIFDLAQEIVEKNYGKTNPSYEALLLNKSKFYADITDYESAIKYGIAAKECAKTIYGVNNDEYAKCLMGLAGIYVNAFRFDESKEVLTEAISIFENINNPFLQVGIYTNLMSVYASEKNWNEFDSIFNKACDIIEKNSLQESDAAASIMGTLGHYLSVEGDSTAKNYLGFALSILEKNGHAGSIQHFASQLYYCLATFHDGSQLETFIPTLTTAYKNLFKNNVAAFNSGERERFVTSQRFAQLKDVLFSSRTDGEYDDYLYDYLLFNKGLLLGTSLRYVKAIYNSGDEDLIKQYNTLLEINHFLNGEDYKLEREYTITEAKTEASVIERKITNYLQNRGELKWGDDISYKEIQTALTDKDLAIEFIDFFDFSEDVSYYAAMLLKKDFPKPIFVKLCKTEDIEMFISLSPDKLYSESAESTKIYDLVWTPISNYFTSVDNIYFSPSGYIHKLAVEHLYNGGKHFDEMFNVKRVSSTRSICDGSAQNKFKSAVLYGGLVYDENDEVMIAESRNIIGNKTDLTNRYSAFTRGETRKGWNYLPGSLTEVKEISSIMKGANINNDVYSAEKGNEESFKALSGKKHDIIHIATHGFFMTESQAETSDFFSAKNFDINKDKSISALSRTGLLMSGGNKVWCGKAIPEHIEDGILTASEISELNLFSCDIAVLSACETGLGDVSNEGVFGLQRAFKIAGVNTIVMSLWKVDDNATSLMMVEFYKNLVSGLSKHESFIKAKKTVREKYPEPYYWAAFIMLD